MDSCGVREGGGEPASNDFVLRTWKGCLQLRRGRRGGPRLDEGQEAFVSGRADLEK